MLLGTWAEWDQWCSCSVTCGRGIRSRRRSCIGYNCPGTESDLGDCSMDECIGLNHLNLNTNVANNIKIFLL